MGVLTFATRLLWREAPFPRCRRGASRALRTVQEFLAVMSRDIGQPGHRWVASDRAVGAVVIVEVGPVWERGSSFGF